MADGDDAEARSYVDAIPAEHRPLFDRIEGLIRAAFPQATMGWSYKMPTFIAGTRRLYVAAWAHGVSLYGWASGSDFVVQHPELLHGRGTIRLRPGDAASITDEELLGLISASLGDG